MGDMDSTDCSWKKLVINNKWMSSVKSEYSLIDSTASTTNMSLELGQNMSLNVKKEPEETALDHQPLDSVIREHEESGAENCVINEPITLTHEMDPLLILEPEKRRRRRESGPKCESPNERASRLAKMSAYAAQRLANESPEQRANRLRRMSEYAAKRLSQESSSQRAKRLARMSAYAAKRLANESPEQRQVRLARMSAYAARKQAMKKALGPSTSNLHSENLKYNLTNIMPNQS